MFKNLIVGQTVYVYDGMWNAPFNDYQTFQELTPSTVSKVGSKFFYLEEHPRYKFNISTGYSVSEYDSRRYKVYGSKEEYVKVCERTQKLNTLQQLFRNCRFLDNVSNEDLDTMINILSRTKEI